MYSEHMVDLEPGSAFFSVSVAFFFMQEGGQVRGAVLLPTGLYVCVPHRDHGILGPAWGLRSPQLRGAGRVSGQQVLPSGVDPNRTHRRWSRCGPASVHHGWAIALNCWCRHLENR